MKKILFPLLSLLLITSVSAQRGNYGGNVPDTHTGIYTQNTPFATNHTHNSSGTSVSGQVNVRPAGHTYHSHRGQNRRIIEKWHPSGRFMWRITQKRIWQPSVGHFQGHPRGHRALGRWVWVTLQREKIRKYGHYRR